MTYLRRFARILGVTTAVFALVALVAALLALGLDYFGPVVAAGGCFVVICAVVAALPDLEVR